MQTAIDRSIAVKVFDICWWKMTMVLVFPYALTILVISVHQLVFRLLLPRFPNLVAVLSRSSESSHHHHHHHHQHEAIPLEERGSDNAPNRNTPPPQKTPPRTWLLWDRTRVVRRMLLIAGVRVFFEVARAVLGSVFGWYSEVGKVWTPGISHGKIGAVAAASIALETLYFITIRTITSTSPFDPSPIPNVDTTSTASTNPLAADFDRVLIGFCLSRLISDTVDVLTSTHSMGFYFAIVKHGLGLGLGYWSIRLVVPNLQTWQREGGISDDADDGVLFDDEEFDKAFR
ncbi:hypothetical protein HDU96_006377 [Phlyctochytrium bullatum]|nr:hypothetical protein HDU96_006377 [Phlyctochytrium bullatum]